jgi:hypothetical protein
MRHAQTRLAVYRNGGHLESDELEALADEMGRLADLCFEFGEMFRLTAVYAEKVRYDCSAFLKMRVEEQEKQTKFRAALPHSDTQGE